MLAQELLLLICALPKLSLSNIKPQHLVLFAVLATGDPLPRLSLEPGQQLTKLQKLLHQQLQSQLPRSLNLNRPPATPGPGEATSTPAPNAPLAALKPLNILPSPPASDGQRLVVSVGRGERLPSFSQLDGQDDSISSPSSSAEVEDDIPVLVLSGLRGASCSFSKRFSAPPARVRHPVKGLATFEGARRDRKDVFMYVNTRSDYIWVSNPA